jgi:subtilase family serine protease
MHPPSRRLWTCAVAGTGLLLTGLLPAATIASASPSSPVALSGSSPAYLTQARDLGPVAGSNFVDFDVLLAVPDQSALRAEIQAVSTPGDAAFRRFLTPAQFQAAYSPSIQALHAVEAWTDRAGLSVRSVAPSRLYVEVTGTAAAAERLVGTTLHTYLYQGRDVVEPASDYRVPASLSGSVSGIVGLDDAASAHPASAQNTLPGPPAGVDFGVQPCSAYYGQKTASSAPPAYGKQWPYTICGYDAKQYEKAFGLTPALNKGIDGHGVTVAITDAYAAPTILSDANTWSAQNGLPAFQAGQFTQDTPAADGYNQEKACGPQGWYGEETLDVEAVHAMAPGASILYVGGANCVNGLDNAWASVIDHHLASVVTNSWTWGLGIGNESSVPPSVVAFFTDYLEEAAVTGITVLFSSGDDGDLVAATGSRQVALPASDPYATGVGGTSTEIGKSGQIVFQSGWSNFYSQLSNGAWTPSPPGTFSSGSGGGSSILFAQPFYQVGVVPKSMSEYSASTPMRTVPDVAMPGDPNTGLRVGETQRFANGTYYATYRIGGTSLSSPLFAGVVADAVAYNGASIGFINPLLYRNIDTSAIDDVLPTPGIQATVRTNLANPAKPNSARQYVLQTIGVPTTIRTAPGYDDMTGVGTPNGMYFLEAMKY